MQVHTCKSLAWFSDVRGRAVPSENQASKSLVVLNYMYWNFPSILITNLKYQIPTFSHTGSRTQAAWVNLPIVKLAELADLDINFT